MLCKFLDRVEVVQDIFVTMTLDFGCNKVTNKFIKVSFLSRYRSESHRVVFRYINFNIFLRALLVDQIAIAHNKIVDFN